MTAIVTKANLLDNDLLRVNRELKRLASAKCRLKKAPTHTNYNAALTEILQEEELLRCVKAYISGPRKNINHITQEEVDNLNLNETAKALNNIRSKKTHTRWLTTVDGDNDEFREACRIEQMLMKHRDAISTKSKKNVSRIEMMHMLDTLVVCSDLSTEECIERIKRFIEEE